MADTNSKIEYIPETDKLCDLIEQASPRMRNRVFLRAYDEIKRSAYPVQVINQNLEILRAAAWAAGVDELTINLIPSYTATWYAPNPNGIPKRKVKRNAVPSWQTK